MNKLINLEDLLKHSILDLYSAEEQIIDALPVMIEKASDVSLKQAFSEHLEVTKRQKERLDNLKTVFENDDETEDKGFFSKLFGGSNTVHCKGIEGLIKEAESLMALDMEPDTMDAALIGAAQKIEHYEIAGYGTARSYAEELNMEFVAGELTQTLDEEYEADEALTLLATEQVNLLAEVAGDEDTTEEDETDDSDNFNNASIEEVGSAQGTVFPGGRQMTASDELPTDRERSSL